MNTKNQLYEWEKIMVLTSDAILQDELATLLTPKFKPEFFSALKDFLENISHRWVLVSIVDIGVAAAEYLETLANINKIKPNISLFVVSEEIDEETTRQLLSHRIMYHFSKPIDENGLLVAITAAFEAHRRYVSLRGW